MGLVTPCRSGRLPSGTEGTHGASGLQMPQQRRNEQGSLYRPVGHWQSTKNSRTQIAPSFRRPAHAAFIGLERSFGMASKLPLSSWSRTPPPPNSFPSLLLLLLLQQDQQGKGPWACSVVAPLLQPSRTFAAADPFVRAYNRLENSIQIAKLWPRS